MVRTDDGLMRQMRTYQLGRSVDGSCFAQLMGGDEYIKEEFCAWHLLLYTANRKRLPWETTQRFREIECERIGGGKEISCAVRDDTRATAADVG